MRPDGRGSRAGRPIRGDQLTIRLVCRNLPSIRFEERREPAVIREPVYLGIQKAKEVVEAVPADRRQVTYDATVRVVKGRDGRPDFLGPYSHGKPNDRFFYLSWGQLDSSGQFQMFRRAKIRLAHLTWDAVRTSITKSKPLIAELTLTDERGGPLCGPTTGQHIKWRL